ncbi:MAG: glycosyltransferase family 9 protein, partial [Candidatus Omnitrophota bacterium]
NSGPLHIAAALGVSTVSTMGPTALDFWWPQGKNHIVIRRDLPCSPCDRAVCRGHECLELISVEEMEKAVEVLLKSGAA